MRTLTLNEMNTVSGGFSSEEKPTEVVIVKKRPPLNRMDILIGETFDWMDQVKNDPHASLEVDDSNEEDKCNKGKQGKDVNGDGKPDFASPTLTGKIRSDDMGDGKFGATRKNDDGTTRLHKGVDYEANEGDSIRAVASGTITNIGKAYPGSDLVSIHITTPDGYKVKMLYAKTDLKVGDKVEMGDIIATQQSHKVEGMKDHVHVEITDKDGNIVDPTTLINSEESKCDGGS